MAKIDKVLTIKEGFPGYEGNPPSNETEYNELFSEWENKPSWSEIETETAAYVSPAQSGYQKLLDLGLTQEEATALTVYTPPEE